MYKRQPPRLPLDGFQAVVGLYKGVQFLGLPGESADHTGAYVIFPGQQGHPVQAVLGRVVDRQRGAHDTPDDQRDRGGGQQEEQREPRADGERHDAVSYTHLDVYKRQGYSTGNHLHLEMKINGVLTNCLNWIPS